MPLSFGVGDFVISNSLHFWINDALMTVFFLVVGMEIRREIHEGALANLKLAALPMIAACGGVLVAWSLVAAREDLWPIGMPLALLGQAGLVLGLVLQLDGLWNSSRRTADSIEALDDELVRVRQATTLLASSHSAPAQSFYVHLAEGAPPQLLLADLKGQLDLLAEQMARQR